MRILTMDTVGRSEGVRTHIVHAGETGQCQDVEHPQVKHNDIQQKQQTRKRECAEKCAWGIVLVVNVVGVLCAL